LGSACEIMQVSGYPPDFDLRKFVRKRRHRSSRDTRFDDLGDIVIRRRTSKLAMPKIDSSDGVSVRAVARCAISHEEPLAIFGFAATGMDLLGY
jgi:hypothetical protein